MLITTTPFLPGRIYREVGVVTGGCSPSKDGPTSSPLNNAYIGATKLLEQYAQYWGCNAVIDLHLVMGENSYILLIGTGIQLEPDARSEEQLRHMWDFLPHLTQDL